MLKILCFGDSITYGENDPVNGGWVELLKKQFLTKYANSLFQEAFVFNLGIGGETTDGLICRFESEFSSRTHKNQNSIVILSYGANDIVIHKGKNKVPQQYFERNLLQSIKRAQSLGGRVVLTGILPIADSNDGTVNQHGDIRFSRDVESYNRLLKNISKENQCQYIDLFAEFKRHSAKSLFCEDGLHPNSEGHQLIFYSVDKTLAVLSHQTSEKQ